MSKRFSVIINDDNGDVSMEVIDYNSSTKVYLTAEDLEPFKGKGINIAFFANLLIKSCKSSYAEIVLSKSENKS